MAGLLLRLLQAPLPVRRGSPQGAPRFLGGDPPLPAPEPAPEPAAPLDAAGAPPGDAALYIVEALCTASAVIDMTGDSD
jgi:hypothetical protein